MSGSHLLLAVGIIASFSFEIAVGVFCDLLDRIGKVMTVRHCAYVIVLDA